MADRRQWTLPTGSIVHAVFSDRSDGDLAIDVEPALLAERRAALAPTPWTWLTQVHGSTVLRVRAAGEHQGAEADGSLTDQPGVALAVQVADCAPVLLFGGTETGAVVAAVHAGWRGIRAGVIAAAVEAMAELGSGEVSWTIGPCISPRSYEFSKYDLDSLVEVLGESVRSRTSGDAPALDMRAAVAAGLAGAGVVTPPLGPPPVCTGASEHHWSHRNGRDASRQVGVIWWERESVGP